MDRRDFLKGLMGLAGVAALGLPPLTPQEAVSEVEEYLADVPERPAGDYGSVRVDGTWYALDYAAFVGHTETISLDSDDVVLHTYTRVVSAHAEIRIVGEWDELDPSVTHDIELVISEPLFHRFDRVFVCKGRLVAAAENVREFVLTNVGLAAPDRFARVPIEWKSKSTFS